MRKFITGCCCLIVGLEVLICIPLAVIVAYAYGQASAPFPLTAEARADLVPVATSAWHTTESASIPSCAPFGSCNSPAECQPAPSHPVPLAYAPSALPAAGYDSYPARPSISPLPAAIPRIELPESPLPLSLSATTSSYASAPSASQPSAPASDSLAAAAPAGASGQVSDDAEPQPESAAAEELQQLVSDWHRVWTTAVAMQPFAAGVCDGEGCPLATTAANESGAAKAAQKSLHESLHETALLLYREADRCEVETDFDQADHLRKMARELRLEAMSMAQRRQGAEVDQPAVEINPLTPPPAPQPMY